MTQANFTLEPTVASPSICGCSRRFGALGLRRRSVSGGCGSVPRSPNMQGELAKFDALKGQIYTSPGQAQRRPGLRTQNDLSLFFQSGLAHRAKPDWKKREVGCEVSFTQGAGPS